MDPAALPLARAWLADCIWDNLDAEAIAELTDQQIYRGLIHYYEGGWAQFLADAGLTPAAGPRSRLSALAA